MRACGGGGVQRLRAVLRQAGQGGGVGIKTGDILSLVERRDVSRWSFKNISDAFHLIQNSAYL